MAETGWPLSGMCGWLGAAPVGADPRQILEGMSAGLGVHPDFVTHSAVGPYFGLALRAHRACAHWCEEPDAVVAIEGYPRWRDRYYRKLAEKIGHAAAFLQGYRALGCDVLKRIDAAASIAVAERQRLAGMIAIDRFGIGTMRWSEAKGETIVFGSTTDAVRVHPGVSSTVRAQRIFEYLYFVDRIPGPHCVYAEQRKLLPAECLCIEDGAKIRTQTYWRMPYDRPSTATSAALQEELRRLMREAVARSLNGSYPDSIGAFLSGGLDSSTILGILSEFGSGQPKAFTIGFDREGYDETPYARLAAKAFGARHDVYYIQPSDVMDALPRIASFFDEPFANSSAVPAYICALMAKKQGIDVMVAGDGGDELFVGNSRYLDDRIFDHYGRFPAVVRRLVERLLLQLPLAARLPPTRRVASYVRRARRPVAERMARNPLLDGCPPEFIFSADVLADIDVEAPLRFAEQAFKVPSVFGKIQRMLCFDHRLTLADSDLRKIQGACELAGIRVRYPFLDVDVAEFSAGVPMEVMVGKGELRAFFKQTFEDLLPQEILRKRKHGFGLPFTQFLKEYKPLSDYAAHCLQSLKQRNIFSSAFMHDTLASLEEKSALENGLWDLVSLEIWLKSRNIEVH